MNIKTQINKNKWMKMIFLYRIKISKIDNILILQTQKKDKIVKIMITNQKIILPIQKRISIQIIILQIIHNPREAGQYQQQGNKKRKATNPKKLNLEKNWAKYKYLEINNKRRIPPLKKKIIIRPLNFQILSSYLRKNLILYFRGILLMFLKIKVSKQQKGENVIQIYSNN